MAQQEKPISIHRRRNKKGKDEYATKGRNMQTIPEGDDSREGEYIGRRKR